TNAFGDSVKRRQRTGTQWAVSYVECLRTSVTGHHECCGFHVQWLQKGGTNAYADNESSQCEASAAKVSQHCHTDPVIFIIAGLHGAGMCARAGDAVWLDDFAVHWRSIAGGFAAVAGGGATDSARSRCAGAVGGC